MNWKLFWKIMRITFGAVILISAVVMLYYGLFGFERVDIAYCMFSVLTAILGIIMVVFGIDTLPHEES